MYVCVLLRLRLCERGDRGSMQQRQHLQQQIFYEQHETGRNLNMSATLPLPAPYVGHEPSLLGAVFLQLDR